MRIVIQKEKCIGCEICVNACPEVFMEWGLHMRSVFEVRDPDRRRALLIEKVVGDCPAGAITVDSGQAQAAGKGG
jgi:ferredoxin